MGTNYYLETKICPWCDKAEQTIHIGKSSGGWCFALHVFQYQTDGPINLEEWINKFSAAKTRIKDEYNNIITITDMISIICNRGSPVNTIMHKSNTWFKDNHAEEGPNGLARIKIDNTYCIEHGTGTWDYIIGEFS